MECPICFFNWNSESTMPLILACGHSLCLECCKSLYTKQQVVCPSCSFSTQFLNLKPDDSEPEESFKSRCIESLTKNYTLLNAVPVRMTSNKLRQFKYGMKCKKHDRLIHSYVVKPFSMLCDDCLDDIRGINLTVVPFPEVVQRCRSNLELISGKIQEAQESISSLNLESEHTIQEEVKKHFAGIRQKIIEAKSSALEKIYDIVLEHKEKDKKAFLKMEENRTFVKKSEQELKKLANLSISEKIQKKQYLETLLATSSAIHPENLNSFVLDISVEKEIFKVFKDFVLGSMNVKIVEQVKMENWSCICGSKVQYGKIQCECERFRPIESYPNIIKEKGKPTPSEIHEIQERRDKEMAWINKLDVDTEPQQWYLIDAEWVNAWKSFVLNNTSRQRMSHSDIGVLPPGPINNWMLLKENGELKPKLKPAVHYRAINRDVWETYVFIYSGGPEIIRRSLNIYKD